MENKILQNKYYLYLTEFFSGMAVMAVELGASRLLAPYFSSSQIVYTIIIGTVMIAMALGNIYGGRSADRDPNPDKLYRRIILAALWIAAIPVLGKYIIIGISGALILAINTNFLILAAFLACMVVFVFPLFLLGTVTPCLVKYTVSSLDDSGSVVGTLGASNTIGSIIGTFMPTFVTIPAVGTSITFLIFSGILLALGLVYFLSKGAKKGTCAIAVAIFLACALLGNSDSFAFWEKGLTYEGESIYNYLQVKEDDSSVILSTNVLFGVQSITMKEDRLTGMYYDYAMAAPLMAGVGEEDEAEVLILGMGTGTYARQCVRYMPGLTVEGVEIDQKITDLAHQYFDLPESIKVTTYDGRAYLQADQGKYDVIMVDAYQDITIPFQMSSTEFFTLVRDHLKENGVMVVNMNMTSSQEGNITQYLADTIGRVFPYISTVDVDYCTNRELFASCDPTYLDKLDALIPQIQSNDLYSMMVKVRDGLVEYTPGDYVLTDDKAGVELLGMRAIDEIIGNEIAYYKAIFKEKGIQGLLESM